MLQTGLLFSLFPDLQRALGDRNPSKKREVQYFLALLGLADQLIKTGRPIPESTLLALFLTHSFKRSLLIILFSEKENVTVI